MAAARSRPREVFIVECVRTPIGRGKKDGALHNSYHPVDLLATTLKALVEKAGVDPNDIEDVIAGCVSPLREQGANVGRLAVLKAGWPVKIPGVQLNRMCGSGQQAIHFAAQAIASGDMEMVVACGVEMMSVVPIGADTDLFSPAGQKFASTFPVKMVHQGVSAELVAEKYGVSRQQADDFSTESHRRAHAATVAGKFKREIIPLSCKRPDGTAFTLDRDEGVRDKVEASQMAKLATIFKKEGGIVTAGNASQISDGAGAVLLCSGEKAEELRLRKRARIITRVVVGSDPELMLDGVIPASRAALRRAGLDIRDISAVEINEAFASVVLAWAKELAPPEGLARVNPNGGAIAHGHPLGATGAILMTKLVHHLEETGGRYGLQTMCIGHGQATATIIENLSATNAARL